MVKETPQLVGNGLFSFVCEKAGLNYFVDVTELKRFGRLGKTQRNLLGVKFRPEELNKPQVTVNGKLEKGASLSTVPTYAYDYEDLPPYGHPGVNATGLILHVDSPVKDIGDFSLELISFIPVSLLGLCILKNIKPLDHEKRGSLITVNREKNNNLYERILINGLAERANNGAFKNQMK